MDYTASPLTLNSPSSITDFSSGEISDESPATTPSTAALLRRRRGGATQRTFSGDRRTKTLVSVADDGDRSSTVSSEQCGEIVDDGAESSRELSALEFFAGFVIRVVFFQFNLLVNCFVFPFWLVRWCFGVLADPFETLRLVACGLRVRVVRVWDGSVGKICSVVMGRRHGAKNLVGNLVWWWLWSFYVCVVLSGLLVSAFMLGSLLMRRIVEEPAHIVRELNFDYTKAKPDALAPIGFYGGFYGSGEKVRVGNHEGRRLVLQNHKLEVTVSLILPESDYNKKLGMFQVRVEFLSADGKVLSTSSLPCMLKFKSSHILLIETFLRSVPLVSGYSSETQAIKVKMTGFNEGTEPIACIRVIIEQRAEFKQGAGIPEIYSASLRLDSQLPLFKRMIWTWRRTLFMWITVVMFVSELLVVLTCCWPIIVPASKPRSL